MYFTNFQKFNLQNMSQWNFRSHHNGHDQYNRSFTFILNYIYAHISLFGLTLSFLRNLMFIKHIIFITTIWLLCRFREKIQFPETNLIFENIYKFLEIIIDASSDSKNIFLQRYIRFNQYICHFGLLNDHNKNIQQPLLTFRFIKTC